MPALNLSLHQRQTDAFLSNATEQMYGGAAGGGKSHLLRVAPIIWCSEIPGLQVYLFRRLSDDLFKNHMSGPGSFPELLGEWLNSGHVTYNGSKNNLTFWNKSCIWMCHCQYEKDVIKYQGAEIHVLELDEMTHFTEYQYRFLRGRLRLGGLKVPQKYKGMFPRVLNGSNPGGIGHNYVKRMFVQGSQPLEVRTMPKDEGGLRRQYIPARLQDNPTLADNDPDYAHRLTALGNPALVKAMRDGNWDIVAGGALDDVWNKDVHIIPRFEVPAGWRVDRSLDWGSDKPFSVGWWAEADGTDAHLPNGAPFCPPKGTLVRIAEWYGTTELGSNKGIRLGSIPVAQGILKRESLMREEGWIKSSVIPGPADNSISSVQDEDSDSVAIKMAKERVRWSESDKSPGSRKVGLQLLRDRMEASVKGEGVGIYFTENCHAAIATLPVLPRDMTNTEDVDSDAEDHVYDEVRYRVLSNAKKYATSVKTSFTR